MVLGLTIALLAAVAAGFEFEIRPSDRVCFMEEFPEGVRFQGRYGSKETKSFPVRITIESPSGVLYTHDDLVPDGKFSFTTTASGEHKVCFVSEASTVSPDAVRLCYIDMELGRVPEAVSDTASTQELSIRGLNAAAQDMNRALRYQREMEEQVRSKLRGVSWTVVGVSLFCIALVWIVCMVTGQWMATTIRKRL